MQTWTVVKNVKYRAWCVGRPIIFYGELLSLGGCCGDYESKENRLIKTSRKFAKRIGGQLDLNLATRAYEWVEDYAGC